MGASLFVAAVLVSFAALHSGLATLKAKEWASSVFGVDRVGRYYRFFYTLSSFLLTAAAALFFVRTPDIALLSLSPPVIIVFRILQGVALVFAAFGFGVFRAGEFLGLKQVVRRPGRGRGVDIEGVSLLPLQKKGVYGIVRHPMYSGCIAFFLFSPNYSRNWLILRVLAVAYFIYGALVEDRRLVKSYGEEYRRYMQQVPRLLPRFGRSAPPVQDRQSTGSEHLGRGGRTSPRNED